MYESRTIERASNNLSDNEIVKENISGFPFLKRKNNRYQKYYFDYQPMINQNANHYSLKICIIIPNDTPQISKKLDETIKNIYLNMTGLQELAISEKNILLCLFLQTITNDETAKTLFDMEINKINSSLDNAFHCAQMQCESEINYPIDVVMCYKHQCKPVEAITCFYYGLVVENEASLKRAEKHYMMMMECGAIFNDKKIRKLILSTQKNDDPFVKTIASVPSIETVPSGLFSRIQHYEQFHSNIYDLHYYSMSCTVPINSKFCVIVLYNEVYNYLNQFYKEIAFDASLSYHDFSLGIFLSKAGYDILYVPSIEIFIDRKDISFSDLFDQYSEKNQANFAVAFQLLSFLIQCSNCLCMGKKAWNHFFIIFLLIGILTDFVFSSLLMEVMYTIFFEGFGINDLRPSTFFTVFYMLIIVLTIFYSILYSKVINFQVGYFILFVFFNVYYLFILFCSVVAMDNVNKNKTNDPYEFNTAAIVLLILLNVIFGIVPMLLNIRGLIHHIGDMFIYFFIGCANYSSLFLMHSIFNSNEAQGALLCDSNKNRKGFILMAFVFANALFGFIIFGMIDRTSRVNCILALAITYTIYNFFKMMAIVINRKCYYVSLQNEVKCDRLLLRMREEKQIEQQRFKQEYETEMNQHDVIDSEENFNKEKPYQSGNYALDDIKEEPYQSGNYAPDRIQLDRNYNNSIKEHNEFDSNEEENSNTSSPHKRFDAKII